ncbi:hypothetical protein DB346_20025 [Verrucomicrobia bacterium LW23]|nr:hypothetical protein DB346_20025 [Verrucomicrobia bacterium LW23]
MLDKAKIRAIKRNARRSRHPREYPLADLTVARNAVQELQPYVKAGREAFEHAYATVLRQVYEKKEALEDYIAERKAAARLQPPAPKIHPFSR